MMKRFSFCHNIMRHKVIFCHSIPWDKLFNGMKIIQNSKLQQTAEYEYKENISWLTLFELEINKLHQNNQLK